MVRVTMLTGNLAGLEPAPELDGAGVPIVEAESDVPLIGSGVGIEREYDSDMMVDVSLGV